MGKVSTLITTIILVSLVFTGFTTFLSGLQSEYDFEIEENYTGTYDALEMNAILEEEGMDYGSMADASGNFEEGQGNLMRISFPGTIFSGLLRRWRIL